MALPGENKYQLKTLHDEIDLFDRKLAHLLKYDVFPSDAARDAAARKLTLKRELLVNKAKAMTDEGVEFQPNDLPGRSVPRMPWSRRLSLLRNRKWRFPPETIATHAARPQPLPVRRSIGNRA